MPAGGWSRRRFLTAGAATVGLVLAPRAVGAPGGALEIFPRSAWAGSDRPPGPIRDEPDVRVLVVHHTVSPNDYAADRVVPMLRDIHAFHTGPEKGWPDIAYNFMIDRFGRVWETRAGSLERTVAGDATGGNQGFDQKCAFLGDHTSSPPSDAAAAAMTGLLGWLADRSGIDTAPGATASFTSRGSNRHAAGTEVVTPTITGHRTMSFTSCPGDAGWALVERLPERVSAVRAGAPTTVAPTTRPPSTATTVPSSTAPTTGVAPPPSMLAAPPEPAGFERLPFPLPLLGVAGAAAAGLGAVLARRARRGR